MDGCIVPASMCSRRGPTQDGRGAVNVRPGVTTNTSRSSPTSDQERRRADGGWQRRARPATHGGDQHRLEPQLPHARARATGTNGTSSGGDYGGSSDQDHGVGGRRLVQDERRSGASCCQPAEAHSREFAKGMARQLSTRFVPSIALLTSGGSVRQPDMAGFSRQRIDEGNHDSRQAR